LGQHRPGHGRSQRADRRRRGVGLGWFFTNYPGGDDTINSLNNPSQEHLDSNA
jgi:hypothetical protein